MQSLFIVALLIFSASTLYFLVSARKTFNSPFLVSLITVASYAVMLEGSLAAVGTAAVPIYYTRWIFYALSCTLLIYEIAHLLAKSQEQTLELLYLTAIVMLTGAFSSYYSGTFMLIFFVISTFAYVFILKEVLGSEAEHKAAISKYMLAGWTGFPIVFLLAPEGFGLIGNLPAAVLYLVLDVFTKIVFYLEFAKASKQPAA